MIYQTKSNILEKDTLIMSLSKTLAVDSILKEKDWENCWMKYCPEISRKLLLHTRTGSVDLDLNCSKRLQNTSIAGSWFSTKLASPLKKNLSKILFPLSMCSPVGFMDSENILIRSRKIRIYPNKKQTQLFKQYLGLSRYWFNQGVNLLNNSKEKASLSNARKIYKHNHPDWAFDSPQRIREHALADACKAIKNAKLKFKRTGKIQKVSYRRKKRCKQGFGFDKQSLKESEVFKQKKYRLKFKPTEKINPQLEGCRIILENGRWFVVIPITVNIKVPENQRYGVIALDPGVRTFLSFFSPVLFGKVGESDFKRIYRLGLNIDKLISKMSKADYKHRRQQKKALQRLKWKIKDLIADMHKKIAYFLVTNFDVILIPEFNTSKMVTKLRSKTARSMLTFAHYRFKSILKAKAIEYSCKVIEVSESYTSRTCSYCGKQNKIGSKTKLSCSCGKTVDRDLNGARNIFIKNLNLIQNS